MIKWYKRLYDFLKIIPWIRATGQVGSRVGHLIQGSLDMYNMTEYMQL